MRGDVARADRKVTKRTTANKALSEAQRSDIIYAHGQGMSGRAIAELQKVGRKQVRLVLARFQKNEPLGRRQGSGPKRKTTPGQDAKLILDIKRDPKLTIKDILKLNPDVQVSAETVRSRLWETGEFGNYLMIRKPLITKKNRLARLAWAQVHKNWTVEQWRRVIWSDESPFVLRCKRRPTVWRRHSERLHIKNTIATVKHDKKINVWGCFSAHAVGRIHLVEGIMESNQYVNILRTQLVTSAFELYEDSNWIFQQDNDPKHTSRVTKAFMAEASINLLPWPSQSPDLNPIENLWSILDVKLKDRRCNNETELFECISNGWNALDISTLSHLVDSMPDRCKAVIEAKGMMTKY